MPQWRKLHVKSVDSLDINDMPDDFTRLFWVMLPLGLDSAGRGIDNGSWIKSKIFPLRQDVTPQQIECGMAWFHAHGMIERYQVGGRDYFLATKFSEYQGNTEREAASVIPAPVKATRKTKSRLARELLLSKSMTDVDVDVDVDVEESSGANAPEPPTPTKKPTSRSDPRTKTPEIQAFHQLTGRYPNLANYDEVIIAARDKTIDQLAPFYREWTARNYNPGSIKWLTEWAAQGSIPGKNGAGNGRTAGQELHSLGYVDANGKPV